jgi:L-threonylcarbamoyladenylate synthase
VPKGFKVVKVLSPTGNLLEAAAHLFEALHQLDRLGLEVIYAEPVPEEGLGRAIMDRLRRAASADAPRVLDHLTTPAEQ